MKGCGRTAPSTTGYPHPGTLLSGLLSWLDARHRGARFIVRLEDLDPERSRPAYVVALGQVFTWLGLEVDVVQRQSRHGARYAEVLDALAGRGLLYACDCTRSRLVKLAGAVGEVGTAAYDNRCRTRAAELTGKTWRRSPGTVRLRLGSEGGAAPAPSDPIVRRRNGSVGYALASVVDDAALGVTRVVRGQDLSAHEALHRAVYRCLGAPAPQFIHHPLLYAPNAADKLAKLHHAVPIDPAAPPCAAPTLLGALGRLAGVWRQPGPAAPGELLRAFCWHDVPAATTMLRWTAPWAAAPLAGP